MPPSALAIDVPQIRRGHTEAAAEGAVEIGQVAKAASIGDRRDRPRHQPRMQQQAMRAVEPLVQDIGGKAACLFLKQAADVAWTDPHPRRHASDVEARVAQMRSEAHTSELQSLMRISYAVFCLKTTHKINNNRANN